MRIEHYLLPHIINVTEQGAIAAAKLRGNGDKNGADQAAVEAMRRNFNKIPSSGKVYIGEGERDEAPMLYIGEEVGIELGKFSFCIAIDPLENTNATAKNEPGAVSVVAISEIGGLRPAPDVYMSKCVGGPRLKGIIGLDKSPEENVAGICKAYGINPRQVNIEILDRPRNQELIERIRTTGAQVTLIQDGDLMPGIATCYTNPKVHAVMGIGAAPEGVITAAGVRCSSGTYEGRFWFDEKDKKKAEVNKKNKERLIQMGGELGKKYNQDELAPGKNLIFCATAVTDGRHGRLKGVKLLNDESRAVTHTRIATLNTYLNTVVHSEHDLRGGRKRLIVTNT